MAAAVAVDLAAAFGVDKLLEIRTSRMKKMAGLEIESGIDKRKCPGPMRIDKLGLEGDEHDLTFHGGPDKAILGYCSSHYPDWRALYPDRDDRFMPGGFGENFVTAHMNERNVCIGDIVAVGPEVQLQVSLPRQPCFKLNHRFSLKNFAPTTYQTSRTGWYYRVLREGIVNVGDEMRLVERKWPKWTIERVQEYLHRNKDDLEMNKELAAVEALGEESRGQFRNRVAKALRRNEKDKEKRQWRDFRLVDRKMQTPRIISVVLEAEQPDNGLENFLPGAHAKVKLPNGLVRSYSAVSGDKSGDIFNVANRIELGIALDPNTRGASRYFHQEAKVGDILQVGKITTDVNFASAASNHIFVAGGIGITAFLALMRGYTSNNWSWRLHYAVRSAEDIPFRDLLEAYRNQIAFYDRAEGHRMDIEEIIRTAPWNSHFYFCGPPRMMEAAKAAVQECGVTDNEVHYEAFSADVSGDPFEALIANQNGKLVQVGEDETLLDALRREFDEVPSSCEVGNCGTCKLTVRSGRIDHRGSALGAEERETSMLSCVSRGVGRIAIEI